MRPLHKLEQCGVTVTQARVVPGNNDATVDAFRRAMRENTRLVVCTHVSNCGAFVCRLRALPRWHISTVSPVCVDAAQSAGILPVFLEEDGVDYLCAAPS